MVWAGAVWGRGAAGLCSPPSHLWCGHAGEPGQHQHALFICATHNKPLSPLEPGGRGRATLVLHVFWQNGETCPVLGDLNKPYDVSL